MRVKLQDIREHWKDINSEVMQQALYCESKIHNAVKFKTGKSLLDSINHIRNFCNGHLIEETFLYYFKDKFIGIGQKGYWVVDEIRPTRGEPDMLCTIDNTKWEFKTSINQSIQMFIDDCTAHNDWDINNIYGKFHGARHIIFCSGIEGYKLYRFDYNEEEGKWYYKVSELNSENWSKFAAEQWRTNKLDYWYIN